LHDLYNIFKNLIRKTVKNAKNILKSMITLCQTMNDGCFDHFAAVFGRQNFVLIIGKT